jgi:hypothetical protein
MRNEMDGVIAGDQPSSVALEQGEAELLLERENHPADRRLRQPEPIRRGGDAAELREGLHRPKLAKVHQGCSGV